MKNTIDRTIQRTQRYWYIDGLTEIYFGFISLLMGIYFYLQASLPQDSLLYQSLTISFVLIIIGGAALGNWAIRALKARITYPRTGFVAYPPRPKYRRWLLGGLSFLVAVLFTLLLTRLPKNLTWPPLLSGVVVGAVWLYIGVRLGLARFYLLAAFSLLAGFLLAVSGLDESLSLAVFYSLIALSMILSGGITFAVYLRSTRPVKDLD